MKHEYNIKVLAEIVDDRGNHLALRLMKSPQQGWIEMPGLTEPKYYNFHSLVWDRNDGTSWKRKATITRGDLEMDGRRRWISEIDSLDAENCTAIIKLAEDGDRVTYSWREWDLCHNKEVRIIKVCDDPSEPLGDFNASA